MDANSKTEHEAFTAKRFSSKTMKLKMRGKSGNHTALKYASNPTGLPAILQTRNDKGSSLTGHHTRPVERNSRIKNATGLVGYRNNADKKTSLSNQVTTDYFSHNKQERSPLIQSQS
jgi:hypothetical protein